MTLSPKLGVVGISTLWHFRLPLPIQMFIKVASSPRLSGIGMPSPILWSHPLKMQRIVLLSSLLWRELGINSLITGPGDWLSFRRFTSKLSWSWSWSWSGLCHTLSCCCRLDRKFFTQKCLRIYIVSRYDFKLFLNEAKDPILLIRPVVISTLLYYRIGNMRWLTECHSHRSQSTMILRWLREDHTCHSKKTILTPWLSSVCVKKIYSVIVVF